MAQQNTRPPAGKQQLAPVNRNSALSVKGFSEGLQKYESLISKLVPKHFPAERLLNLAVNAFMRNEDLRKCNFLTIVNSVCVSAQLGLEPNTPLGHAYLIPYKEVCTFQPGYRGLMHLALLNDRVHAIDAHVVYDNDYFDMSYGTDAKLTHRPDPRARQQEKGEWIGAYCVLEYKEGGRPSFLYMTRDEIEAIRDQSSQARSGPWTIEAFRDEMRRKTPTKRRLKYQELGPRLGLAVGYDDQVEAGKPQDILLDVTQGEYEANFIPSPDEGEQDRREGQAGSSAPMPQQQSQTQQQSQQQQPQQQQRAGGGLTTSDFKVHDDLQTIRYALRTARGFTPKQIDEWLAAFRGTTTEAVNEAARILDEYNQKQESEGGE